MLGDQGEPRAALGIDAGEAGANAADRSVQIAELPQRTRAVDLDAAQKVLVAAAAEVPPGALKQLQRVVEPPLGMAQDGLEMQHPAGVRGITGAALEQRLGPPESVLGIEQARGFALGVSEHAPGARLDVVDDAAAVLSPGQVGRQQRSEGRQLHRPLGVRAAGRARFLAQQLADRAAAEARAVAGEQNLALRGSAPPARRPGPAPTPSPCRRHAPASRPARRSPTGRSRAAPAPPPTPPARRPRQVFAAGQQVPHDRPILMQGEPAQKKVVQNLSVQVHRSDPAPACTAQVSIVLGRCPAAGTGTSRIRQA